MKWLQLFLLLGTSALAPAADIYEPALAPLVEKHAAEVKKQHLLYDGLITGARETYLEVLKKADETSTGKGDLAQLAKITKEVEAVRAGTAAYLQSPELPSGVQAARRNYVKAVDKADLDFTTAMKKTNTAYLAALGRIQPALGKDLTLADQITNEKKRLLARPAGVILDARNGMDGTVWQHIDKPGDKITFKDGMVNKSWSYSTPSANKITVHWTSTSSRDFELSKNGRILLINGKPNRVLVPDARPTP